MVVDVGLASVLALLRLGFVVVAVGERAVIVLVGVPVRVVLPFSDRQVASVMMRDVVVVVGMNCRSVRVRGLSALTLDPLIRRWRCYGVWSPAFSCNSPSTSLASRREADPRPC